MKKHLISVMCIFSVWVRVRILALTHSYNGLNKACGWMAAYEPILNKATHLFGRIIDAVDTEKS